MANEVAYSPSVYIGNGITKEFSFEWKILNEADLIVSLYIDDENYQVLTLGSDYQVEKEQTGGTVIFKTAPATQRKVVIERYVSNYQGKRYSTSTGFQGDELEKSFDRVSCNIQDMEYNIADFKDKFRSEIQETINNFEDETEAEMEEFEASIRFDLDRALKLPVGSTKTPEQYMEDLFSIEANARILKDTTEGYRNESREYANSAEQDKNTATEQANLAKDWATKTNGKVANTDYSAKYYANEAKSTVDNAIDNINSAKDNAIGDISARQSTAQNEINSTKNNALNEIRTEENILNTSLATAKDYAQKAIGWNISYESDGKEDCLVFTDKTQGEIDSALNYVSEAKNNALSEIQSAVSTGTNTISSTTDSVVSSVQAQGISSINEIDSLKDGVLNDVSSAKDDAISNINSTEDGAISNINSTKDNALNEILTEENNINDSLLAAKDYAQKAIGWNISYESDGKEDCLVFKDKTQGEIEEATNYIQDAKEASLTSINELVSDSTNLINNSVTEGNNAINSARNSALEELNNIISNVIASIEESKQTCLEMAERATFGWNIEYKPENCLTFTVSNDLGLLPTSELNGAEYIETEG